MCGAIGIILADEQANVNQMLFDGMTVLQHRGQDAAGMVTCQQDGSATSSSGSRRRSRLHLRKENGLVKDVFHTHHMMELVGNVGIGHVRYPTAGTSSCAEAQPLYTNYPYGICVAHNGNLTNTRELGEKCAYDFRRHANTDSDSELLLNIFADRLASESDANADEDMADRVFGAMEAVLHSCKGGFAGIYLINGYGLVGFRDPHGIRPIVYGSRTKGQSKDYVMASESVAIDTLGFDLVRDIDPGEAIFIDTNNNIHTRICHPKPELHPCIFEHVYFARPDSIIDGVSVYESRLRMGEALAKKVDRIYPDHDIDVVIPIPDTSRTSALQAAYQLGRPFREGFIKNRYIARTFIMPGQEVRKKSVRLKLNTIKSEFAGKNVLLVDDSIVRGTTAREIVQMARDAGAQNVYFVSAAPPIRYPNIYGIDIPTRVELVAHERDAEQVAAHIGADWVIYQDLEDLEKSVASCMHKTQVDSFESSCFSGRYVTGERMGDAYFTALHEARNDDAQHGKDGVGPLPPSHNGCESMMNTSRDRGLSIGRGCESLSNNQNKR
mmetsp:Transcript_21920/g.49903  ORF Transcript_21920/g.49903 Transcript_21920/m.49903 type:complete len:553 (-) Transcript_21920:103-1761(-)|eukprot:CAMPEP_0113319844 /NCGR_PEP_ID=MMETSP0010_2-20120614/13883_1 /TAXON_ID=216773 ORGANISM="Corethron hystrix, Strain 308" /NCGR_SAMPLE_ID=MMETSP0010_2 /ASSEMBLY_ACC=CAM_ASM_000155 /LENGTH=552 /DNA_ID=CAMNT_0000177493 /DNA_START=253 /DNA_END=1911 /DNA_ORIENTATION=- /assembly_acc=CAM_ASM_000155